jgi:hypothetical protein
LALVILDHDLNLNLHGRAPICRFRHRFDSRELKFRRSSQGRR